MLLYMYFKFSMRRPVPEQRENGSGTLHTQRRGAAVVGCIFHLRDEARGQEGIRFSCRFYCELLVEKEIEVQICSYIILFYMMSVFSF